MLLYEAYGGKKNRSDIIRVACAWEMLHACLLVHDDIIDRDLVRHNRPNIAGRYQSIYSDSAGKHSTHYALSAALLAGDLLLSSSYDMVNKSTLSASEKIMINNNLQSALFAVAGGELLDFEYSLQEINSSDVDSININKTVKYSFELPMLSGASLANAPEQEMKKISSLAIELGIAFQLKDDLLGVFGDEQKTGKSNRTDIFEKKRTLLVKIARDNLDPAQASKLDGYYNIRNDLSAAQAEEVVNLLTDSGAIARVEAEIAQRSAESKAIISTLIIGNDHKEALYEIVEKVASRTV